MKRYSLALSLSFALLFPISGAFAQTNIQTASLYNGQSDGIVLTATSSTVVNENPDGSANNSYFFGWFTKLFGRSVDGKP